MWLHPGDIGKNWAGKRNNLHCGSSWHRRVREVTQTIEKVHRIKNTGEGLSCNAELRCEILENLRTGRKERGAKRGITRVARLAMRNRRALPKRMDLALGEKREGR